MNQAGFTLLELLLTMLIIGVLAALAYPSLEVAVWKARAVKTFPAGKYIARQAALYNLEHGHYPTQEDFAGELQAGGNISFFCADGSTEPASCRLVGTSLRAASWADPIILFFNAEIDPTDEEPFLSTAVTCVATRYRPEHAWELSRRVCRALGGKNIPPGQDSFLFFID